MKSVAPDDRPREKLQRLGAGALGDNELLAIVLGQGHGEASALDLANAVLAAGGGAHRLARVPYDELRRVPGIGAARAAQVLAAVELGRRTMTRAAGERVQITTPRIAAELLMPRYGGRSVEQFGVVLLDAKFHWLATRIVSVGALDRSIASPRDVFREAVAVRAAFAVVFHNHPSGDATPSQDDIVLTMHLADAADLLGIGLLDHLILTATGYYSFKEQAGSDPRATLRLAREASGARPGRREWATIRGSG